MPTSSDVSGTVPTATASHSPTLIPKKIAMPPTSGVGCSCQRSALGVATRRVASGDRSNTQTASRTAGKAAIAAAALTCGGGGAAGAGGGVGGGGVEGWVWGCGPPRRRPPKGWGGKVVFSPFLLRYR